MYEIFVKKAARHVPEMLGEFHSTCMDSEMTACVFHEMAKAQVAESIDRCCERENVGLAW